MNNQQLERLLQSMLGNVQCSKKLEKHRENPSDLSGEEMILKKTFLIKK